MKVMKLNGFDKPMMYNFDLNISELVPRQLGSVFIGYAVLFGDGHYIHHWANGRILNRTRKSLHAGYWQARKLLFG